MVDSDIIEEIKKAIDDGVKLSPTMQNRLVLAALLQLYRANNELTEALSKHIESSEAAMKEKLGEHDRRIEKLERHDIITFISAHPKITLAIIMIILALWTLRRPLLSWLGIPQELIP
jgi:hypothetical protein